METLPIPLATQTYKNVDEEELTDLGAEIIDGYVDEAGYCRRRPGMLEFKDINTQVGATDKPINGLYWWTHGTAVFAFANGKIIKLQYDTGSGLVTVTNCTSSTLNANTPVIACTDGTYVFAANGGKITYTNGTAASSAYLADVDAPITVTHVDYLDGYILCNKVDTNKFFWSDVNSSLVWTATSFASAASNPDYITALHVFNREIYLFGPLSVEIWQNDGETPFARIPGGTIETGCIAPYSIVRTEDEIFWLDHNRHFVSYKSGKLSRVSNAYAKKLQSYSSVSDCLGYQLEIDGMSFIVWTFPTEGKTLVYNYKNPSWAEWHFWDTSIGDYARFLGNSHVWAPNWGLHIIGDRRNATLLKLATSIYNDDGQPIRFKKRTGHIDYGTTKYKRSEEIRIRAKRGAVSNATAPVLMFRWRDDNLDWSQENLIDLGDMGETEIVTRLFRTGVFRTRQYEVTATDDAPIIFGAAEEDITLLR